MAEGSLGESAAYQLLKSALLKEEKGENTEEVVRLYREVIEKSPESAEARAANRGLVRITGKGVLSPKMPVEELFFSFKGRIPRTTLWADWVMPIMPILLLMVYFDFSTGTGFFTGICLLVIAYPSLAVGARRCHDRNRSGWFQLLGLIPLVNIWVMIELGFLKGTSGDNKFGSDPLSLHYER